jgi:hypothetical protein
MKSNIDSSESLNKLNEMTDIKQIQVGDIVLFKPRPKLNLNQKTIMKLQSLLPTSFGTSETIHAGVCVGHDENNVPTIIDISGSGLKEYSLGAADSGNNGGYKRSLVIYRAGQEAGIQLAKSINKDVKAKKFSYSLVRFLKTIGKNELHPDRISKKERVIYENTFCSLFVVEAMKKAWQKDEYRKYYPNFKSNISPKQLEHFLSTNNEFMQLCYVGKGSFETLKESLTTHVIRLKAKTDKKSKHNLEIITKAWIKANKEIKEKNYSSEMEKCVCLLSHIMPILEKNNKAAFFHSPAYKEIKSISKQIGLYKHYKSR